MSKEKTTVYLIEGWIKRQFPDFDLFDLMYGVMKDSKSDAEPTVLNYGGLKDIFLEYSDVRKWYIKNIIENNFPDCHISIWCVTVNGYDIDFRDKKLHKEIIINNHMLEYPSPFKEYEDHIYVIEGSTTRNYDMLSNSPKIINTYVEPRNIFGDYKTLQLWLNNNLKGGRGFECHISVYRVPFKNWSMNPNEKMLQKEITIKKHVVEDTNDTLVESENHHGDE